MIEAAFILSAGFGKRLRPHTNDKPKTLVPIAGKPILDYLLDALKQKGVQKIIINLHYCGDQIRDYLRDRDDFTFLFSEEEEVLETGGGLKNAEHLLDENPFFLLNGDNFWDDAQGHKPALERMENAWDPHKMDILLLLQSVSNMKETEAVGDYHLGENGKGKDGKATRALDRKGTHMFASARIVHPRILKQAPNGAYSFLKLMDAAQDSGRLYGLEHQGRWFHISTPEDKENLDRILGKG